MKAYIYEIWIGDYYYHGQTNNLKNRKRQHLHLLRSNKHSNAKMQAVYNKYQSFEMQILLECDAESITDWEQAYIDTNWGDPKYLNLARTAEKPPDLTGKPSPKKGRPMSEESRKRMSEARKDMKLSEEHKRNIGNALKGKKRSEEARQRMSEVQRGREGTFKGKEHSDATKNAMTDIAKNRPRGACPHCGKEMAINHLKRFHLDNCKLYVPGITESRASDE